MSGGLGFAGFWGKRHGWCSSRGGILSGITAKGAICEPAGIPIKAMIIMNKNSTWTGLKVSLTGLLAIAAAAVAHAGDVQQYNIFKAQSFIQAGTGAPVSAGTGSVVFQAEMQPNGLNTVTNVSLKLPNASVLAISPKGDGSYKLKQSFDTTAAMDAVFGEGTYKYQFQTVNDGFRTNALSLTGEAYLPTPHFSNYNAAQMVDATGGFTLMWDAIAGATTNDFIQLAIRDCSNNGEIYSSPDSGSPGSLNGTATFFTIPAGVLKPGQMYTVQLQLAHATTYDPTSYPGATGIAAYMKMTQMNLVTTGAQTGCPFGNFQLVFNYNQGTFGGGTAGSIGFPQAVAYYFALYNVNNDTNYPNTVTFTGPSGSGLNNTTNSNSGSDFGTSAFYEAPQVNVPPFPPGGVYSVNYKGMTNSFTLANLNLAGEQVMIVPSVSINASNVVQQIYWTYKDMNGNTIGAQPFMRDVQVRVDGFSGRIFDTEMNNNSSIAPATTNITPNVTIVWTNVTSIQMVYDDNQNNQFTSFWNRTLQPVVITTSNLPPATQGSFYSFLLSAAGGSQSFNWSAVTNTLPGGLSINPVTGELHGTPSQSGNFNITVNVSDGQGQNTNRTLALVITGTVTGPPKPVLSAPTRLGNGQFQFSFSGNPGQNYTLQASSDLVNWSSLITLNSSNSSYTITDPAAASMPRRFYRVWAGP